MLALLPSLLLLALAQGDQGAGHAPHHTSHHTPTSHHAPISSSQYSDPYNQPAVSLPVDSGAYTVQGETYTYPTDGLYSQGEYTQEDYAQASGYGNYAPATGSAFGYSYDYPLDQENEVDSVSDKQGITNPLAFVPLITSLSLPLGAAVITFAALVSVAAAFLLFPSTVEVDVNGVKRKRSVRSLQDNRLDMAAGLCADSESSICKLLSTILISKDCLEAASCEVASMTNSRNFPVMANIVRPFMSKQYYDRFENMDCSSLKCSLRKF